MTEQDLQYYIDSGEVPDDPEILEKIIQMTNSTDSIEGEVSNKQVEAEDKTEASVATDAKETKEEAVNAEPEGILTADGKHVLPYDVLKAERQRAADLKREADELRQQLAAKSNAVSDQSMTEFTGMSEQDLIEMQEYFPEKYETLVKNLEASNQMRQKLAQIEAEEARRAQEEANQRVAKVQEAIDSNPLLSSWKDNDPVKWKAAIDVDAALLNDPETAKLSIAERLERVTKAVAQLYGIQTEAKPEPTPVKKADEIKVQAKKPPINSLSDLPGGEAPEATELEKLENMSPVEIGALLATMSPEQQQAFFNRLF